MPANQRGSLFMVLAMAGFAVEDMFIKSAAKTMPLGQVLADGCAGGFVVCPAIPPCGGTRLSRRLALAHHVGALKLRDGGAPLLFAGHCPDPNFGRLGHSAGHPFGGGRRGRADLW